MNSFKINSFRISFVAKFVCHFGLHYLFFLLGAKKKCNDDQMMKLPFYFKYFILLSVLYYFHREILVFQKEVDQQDQKEIRY